MSVLDEYLMLYGEMIREHEAMRERVFTPGAVIPEEEIKAFFDRKGDMDNKMIEIANRYMTDPDDIIEDRRKWFPVRIVSSGDYHTQGMGSFMYAKNDAESVADKFRVLGIPVDVEECEWSYNERNWGGRFNTNYHKTYTVVVGCSRDLAYMIIKRSVDLKELIRSYLKRGVNPRVYLPFLPDGIEEKLGLDAFGNDM